LPEPARTLSVSAGSSRDTFPYKLMLLPPSTAMIWPVT
jgi:hypothetical protein